MFGHAASTPGLKAALKRGALIAAANWPLVIVGFVADSSVKLLLAVPIVGGAFLVALLLDTPARRAAAPATSATSSRRSSRR